MDTIKSALDNISAAWGQTRETLKDNPDVLQQHAPGVSLATIDFTLKSTERLLKNVVKPKKAQKRAFSAAKEILSYSLATTQNALSQINNGQYQQLPEFLRHVASLPTQIYTLAFFSADVDKETAKAISTGTASLKEELDQQLSALRQVDDAIDRITNADTEIESQKKTVSAKVADAENALAEIRDHKSSADQVHGKITELENNAQTTISDLEDKLATADTLTTDTSSLKDQLTKSLATAHDHQRNIDGLLAGATTTRLAKSFADKASSLRWPKALWSIVFFIAIGGLVAAAYQIAFNLPDDTQFTLSLFAQRAVIAAPLVWLGWFAARQYGHCDRLQQDYAHKRAVSEAFEGYKNQLQGVESTDKDSNLVYDLSRHAISIISQDPLRTYERAQDETPAWALFNQHRKKSRGSSTPNSDE